MCIRKSTGSGVIWAGFKALSLVKPSDYGDVINSSLDRSEKSEWQRAEHDTWQTPVLNQCVFMEEGSINIFPMYLCIFPLSSILHCHWAGRSPEIVLPEKGQSPTDHSPIPKACRLLCILHTPARGTFLFKKFRNGYMHLVKSND